MTLRRVFKTAVVALSLSGFAACGGVVSSITGGVSEGLAKGIMNQQDTQLVAEGVPTYLLILDGFLESNPDNADVLLATAKLYSAYGGVFVTDERRSKAMLDKAKSYAMKSACLTDADLCALDTIPFPVFQERLQGLDEDTLPYVYGLATTWTGWIQKNSADWNAIADLAKVKALLAWAQDQDSGYDGGSIMMYRGALETILPPAMGGKPEEGKALFEQAIEASDGKNLMAKVLYAERYARLVFDRSLHDSLLQEVLAADVQADGLTLMNTLAQKQARELLASADDYF